MLSLVVLKGFFSSSAQRASGTSIAAVALGEGSHCWQQPCDLQKMCPALQEQPSFMWGPGLHGPTAHMGPPTPDSLPERWGGPCGCLSIALLAGEEINVPTGVSVSLGRCREVNTPSIQACAESWLEPRGGGVVPGVQRGLKGC